MVIFLCPVAALISGRNSHFTPNITKQARYHQTCPKHNLASHFPHSTHFSTPRSRLFTAIPTSPLSQPMNHPQPLLPALLIHPSAMGQLPTSIPTTRTTQPTTFHASRCPSKGLRTAVRVPHIRPGARPQSGAPHTLSNQHPPGAPHPIPNPPPANHPPRPTTTEKSPPVNSTWTGCWD